MKTPKIAHNIMRLFRIFYKLDKVIITILLLLAGINIFIQYSANDQSLNRLMTDTIYLCMSFVILIVVANMNLNHLRSSAVPIYIINILLL